MPGPIISASVTVSPAAISGTQGEPFLDCPSSLFAIPPFPFSPVRFSHVIAWEEPFLSLKIFSSSPKNIFFSSCPSLYLFPFQHEHQEIPDNHPNENNKIITLFIIHTKDKCQYFCTNSLVPFALISPYSVKIPTEPEAIS